MIDMLKCVIEIVKDFDRATEKYIVRSTVYRKAYFVQPFLTSYVGMRRRLDAEI